MELNIFALAFTSAMLHPWREFFIKQNQNPEGACLAAMMVWTTLAALHALIEGVDLFSIKLIWQITLFYLTSKLLLKIVLLCTR